MVNTETRRILDNGFEHTTLIEKIQEFVKHYTDEERVAELVNEEASGIMLLREIARKKREKNKIMAEVLLSGFIKQFGKEEQKELVEKTYYENEKGEILKTREETLWSRFLKLLDAGSESEDLPGILLSELHPLAKYSIYREMCFFDNTIDVFNSVKEVNKCRDYWNVSMVDNPNAAIFEQIKAEDFFGIPVDKWEEVVDTVFNGQNIPTQSYDLGKAFAWVVSCYKDPLAAWNTLPHHIKTMIVNSRQSMRVRNVKELIPYKSMELIQHTFFSYYSGCICFDKKEVGEDVSFIFSLWYCCQKGCIPKYLGARIKGYEFLLKTLNFEWKLVWKSIRAQKYSNMFDDYSTK